jgi:hypothetical protein
MVETEKNAMAEAIRVVADLHSPSQQAHGLVSLVIVSFAWQVAYL